MPRLASLATVSAPSSRRVLKRSLAIALLSAVSVATAAAGCSGEGGEAGDLTGEVSQGLSTGVVISQVFGGGGNQGAPFTHDFIELFNRGAEPVSLAGWSIQYGGDNRAFSQRLDLPAVEIPAGGYFLIQLAGGNNGVALPAADLVMADMPFNMSATDGKVALVASTTTLPCGGPTTRCNIADAIDFVGYGNRATDFEGAPTAAPSATRAVLRKGNGCVETDNNRNDFELAAPNPRTSRTAPNLCATPDAGAIDAGASDAASEGGPIVFVDADVPDSTPLDDAGESDAGSGEDAGPNEDAGGSEDAGAFDAGEDAAIVDAGPSDAAASDAGPTDAGSTDAGSTDAGPTDGGATTPPLRLNEIKIGPLNATAGLQFIELAGAPSYSVPANMYVLAVSGSGATQNRILYARNLGGVTVGANGIVLIQREAAQPYRPADETTVVVDPAFQANVLGNYAMSYIVAQASRTLSIEAGTTTFNSIQQQLSLVDAVGYRVAAGNPLFGGVTLGTFPGRTIPHALTRFIDNDTPRTPDAWYFGRLVGDNVNSNEYGAEKSTNFPVGGRITPGAPNTVATAPTDGGAPDGGSTPRDGGANDGGANVRDSGTDSGSQPSDASTEPSPDGSAGEEDAAVPPRTGAPSDRRDAAARPNETNPSPAIDDAACACRSAGLPTGSTSGAFAGIVVAGIALLRRRRRG
jgi:MYXO-CTERM domain-containing protein